MRQDLYYDLYSKEHNYWWHVGKRSIVYGALNRYLPPGKGRSDRNALDLGCGTGMNLDHLGRYATAYGTDYFEEALHFCRERGHTLLAQADAAALPFASEQFDIITALDVLEHLDDDLAALRELKRVSRPGGLMIISVPAYRLLWTYWDDILGHRRRYTVGSLRTAVQQAGLEVRKISYSNTLTLFPATAVRLLKSVRHKSAETRRAGYEPESDFMPVPAWLNRLLILYYRLEARLLRKYGLPFGLSVICVAQRCPEQECEQQPSR